MPDAFLKISSNSHFNQWSLTTHFPISPTLNISKISHFYCTSSLIFLSLSASETEHLFMYLIAICILLYVNYLCTYFTYFFLLSHLPYSYPFIGDHCLLGLLNFPIIGVKIFLFHLISFAFFYAMFKHKHFQVSWSLTYQFHWNWVSCLA